MQHIAWYFNAPAAPYIGGEWERFTRSFEDTFYQIVGSRTLRDSPLYTFACEVDEFTHLPMNNRPLLHVSSDITDMGPLTPNHLLLGRSQAIVPTGIFESDTEPYSWKKAQVLADSFWSKFFKYYMPSLQLRSKWTKYSDERIPADLVWILEENTARGIWPVGRVKSVTKGTDNVDRSCELITSFRTIKRTLIKLSKLFVEHYDLSFSTLTLTIKLFLPNSSYLSPANGASYVMHCTTH